VRFTVTEGATLARDLTTERSLRGVRVLVVEDLDDTRALILRVLTDAGAEVKEAADVPGALGEIARELPHILISDIGMPRSDGYQLIRKLRAQGHSAQRLPAIALTAFVRTEDASDALEAGYQMHLGKPVNADVLIAAVVNLLAVPGRRPELAS